MSRRSRHSIAICPAVPTLVVLALLTACSSGGSTTGGQTPTGANSGGPSPSTAASTASRADIAKACSMLSKDEVKSLTGLDVSDSTENSLTSSPEQSSCIWSLSAGSSLYLIFMRNADTTFRAMSTGKSPVDGVGDMAFSSNGHLMVLKGTTSMDIALIGTEPADKLMERAVKVAGALCAKL